MIIEDDDYLQRQEKDRGEQGDDDEGEAFGIDDI